MRSRLLAFIVIAIALTGCIRVHNSPAPGCVRYIGLAPMGGCFGTTVIQDLAVLPETACLEFQINNCNGGVLEIVNRCAEPLTLAGLEVGAGERTGADLVEDGGAYTLKAISSNFAEYIPPEDVDVALSGRLGEKDIAVTFTKTAPLCD